MIALLATEFARMQLLVSPYECTETVHNCSFIQITQNQPDGIFSSAKLSSPVQEIRREEKAMVCTTANQ